MASGDSLILFTPQAAQFPDADFATLDAILTASSDEPDHIMPVLDFDPGSTEEYVFFTGVMPRHYGGGGLTLTIGWTSDAVTGAVIWAAAFKRFEDDVDDIDDTISTPTNTATDTTASSAGVVTYTQITFTNGVDMGSIAAGEMFVLEISRNSSNGGDTMNSNDAELHFVEIRET